jgi:hypothetical protein
MNELFIEAVKVSMYGLLGIFVTITIFFLMIKLLLKAFS